MKWFLGIAFIGLVIGFYGLDYFVRKTWNPPPTHLQDLDRCTAKTKDIDYSRLPGDPVDHIYIYQEHSLFGDIYLRYHFVNRADFEKSKDRADFEKSKLEKQPIPPRHEYPVTWEDVAAVPEAIRGWWVHKERPDCELYGTTETYQVYDAANNVVYDYRAGG